MTLAAIEFNDQSLLIQAEDGARFEEPGYARLMADGIVTGEAAHAVAWREPQHIYNQYWCHLNQTPLANPHRFARHHADMAFAQLKELWRQVGEPDELILLVPASFTRAHLSVLLGLAAALPARVVAVMDSGLAACLEIQGEVLFADFHQHEAVITVCRGEGGSVRIVDQEIFPGSGMSQVHNAIARHISDVLIESYRFDPLHSSETEQSIYEQIPQWLTRLGWEEEVSIRLDSENGELPCILRRDEVESLVAGRMRAFETFLGEWPDCPRVLSQASAPLAGLSSEFGDARVARASAATRRALAYRDEIKEQVDELFRMRKFARVESDDAPAVVNGAAVATHLLCGDLALSLETPVTVRITDGGPVLSGGIDKEAALTVVLRNQRLEALHRSVEAELPPSCAPGEAIRVGGHELRLIRVPNSQVAQKQR